METKLPIWKVAWQKWKKIAAKIAHFQGHLLLSLIYILIVAPVAILFKLFGADSFQTKPVRSGFKGWNPREALNNIADFLKKEY